MKIKNRAKLTIAVLFSLISCNKTTKKSIDQSKDSITVIHQLGKAKVALNPKKVIVFDMGTLETLDDLGIPIAGIPKDFVPPHLHKYKTDSNTQDVGSLLQPNLEKVSAMSPDLIIISDLHKKDYEYLSQIAPTISLGIDNNNYKKSIINNLHSIGEIFDIQKKTNQKIAAIETEILLAQKVIASKSQKIMILLYNAGTFSSFGSKSRYGFVFSDLKSQPSDNNTEEDLHGVVVSSEYISKVNPDVLFIIDRNGIMPNHVLNKNEIENTLVQRTNAFKNKKIYYLDPNVWYLSGGGTYSVKHMIEDVLQAYK